MHPSLQLLLPQIQLHQPRRLPSVLSPVLRSPSSMHLCDTTSIALQACMSHRPQRACSSGTSFFSCTKASDGIQSRRGHVDELQVYSLGSYAGSIFKFVITFPDNYPDRPPTVRFVTDVFHPLVASQTGMFNLTARFRPWR